MRAPSLVLIGWPVLCFAAGCAEEERLLPSVFDVPPPLVEVPCPGTEGGSPWVRQEVAGDDGLSALFGLGPTQVWAAGGSGLVLSFDGSSWREALPRALEVDLLGIHGTADDDLWVVGREGQAARWDGRRWLPLATGLTASFSGVWATARGEVWFTGGAGIHRWDGQALRQEPGWPTGQVNAVWAAGPGAVHFVGDHETYFFDGAALHTQPFERAAQLAAVWGTPEGAVYTIGRNTMQRPGFAELRQGRWEVSAVPPRAFYFALWGQRAAALWAGASDTTIFHRADGAWCREYQGGTGVIASFYGHSEGELWAAGAERDAGGSTRPVLLRR